MSAEVTCDQCGQRAAMIVGGDGTWEEPPNWISINDNADFQGGKILDFCRSDCMDIYFQCLAEVNRHPIT